VPLGIAGCGGSDEEESATQLKMSVVEKGKTASFSIPKEVEGGLVEVKLTNEGKAPHGVQFIRYTGNHTAEDVLKEVSGESEETPEWIRGEGGIGSVQGGETQTATLNLEDGKFVIVDAVAIGGEGGGGKPATAELEVSDGSSGDLPDTPGEIVAAETGEDEYEWEVSGLKAGKNQITFASEGDEAIHLIIAVPLKGKVPPLSQIKKDISKEGGPPPPYIDFEGGVQSTAVLDGGKSQTTQLELKKPGKYLLFCPLTDRDGGKSHDQEGLLAVEEVQ
jgi:hypothetical protein